MMKRKIKALSNAILLSLAVLANNAIAAPLIEIWYGDEQSFGTVGITQPYVNILGNVSDSVGIDTLTYAVNGNPPVNLSFGPDNKRLVSAGDINLDIPVSNLLPSPSLNSVVIDALSLDGSSAQYTVLVNYFDQPVWPLPYSIDWATVSNVNDVVQITDGQWGIESTGARTLQVGYDRLLMLGDVTWDNYEVTVPVTIHQLETYSTIALVGHFNGNTDDPFPGLQPKSGWNPVGAFAWYNHLDLELQIYDYTGPGPVFGSQNYPARAPRTLVEGETYNFKLRVQQVVGGGSVYSFKVWSVNLTEPQAWDLQYTGPATDPQFGALGLLAYRTDASFGNVEVVPVGPIVSTPSTLVSDDFDATSLNTSVWTHIDPQSDSTLSFTGTGTSDALMELTVPSGSSHDSWASGINSPYISQAANDVDFEVEVKFESEVLSAWQMQGLLIKENETDFMRFDFYHNGTSGSPYVFSAAVENQSGQYKINNSITAGVPLWMRVNRQGDTWTQSYSYDGQTWTQAGSFFHQMTVTEVGIHSSNYNPNPSHTTQVDYFWNTALSNTDDTNTGGNVAPMADAGNAHTVNESASFTLDGSASSDTAPGSITSYEWSDSTGVLNTSASPTYSHSYATAGTYTVTLTVTDDGGLTDTDTVSVTVNTINNNPSTLVSDDFDATSLNTSVWTHIDPQGDSTLDFSGTGTSDALMELTVPSGSSHDSWTSGINSPYISQAANDVDFEVEVKFESEVLSAWQMQGLLIKENETDFMRFDFYHRGNSGSPYIFSGVVENQSGQYKINNSITAGVPLWMRVNRQGDTWTQSYSYDGQSWTVAGSFVHSIIVTEVGIHSSNYNPNPSHTTQVDYFWNTALSNTDDTNTGGNVAPMADAGNAHTVNESASFTLDGSASSDTAPGSITSYEWSDSTGVLNTSASPTYSHSYATAGTYTVTLTVTDDGGLTDTDTVSVTVNTINNNPSTLVSDDFDATSLNTSVWTHTDPQSDSTLSFTGTGTSDALMELTVPSGSSHDSWASGINSPYISQAANDVDFEVEIKFESPVLSAWQIQGLLIKESETHFMRFDFYHNGTSGSPYVFSAAVENQSGQYKINNSITAGVPLWMRVNRQGDTWTQSYSYDGQSWTVAGSFVHSIIVTEVGIHSSNYNPNPSHTTQVDYFWNTALSNTDDTNTGGNVAPMADAGNAHTVNESASFTLDGSASSDTAPGSITSYEWSDSTGVLNTSASPTYSHSYATAGTYTITLTVTDDGGLTDTDTVSVTVNTGNVAPVADAGSAHTVIEGISFTLDGSASSDTAPGSITSYEWSDSTGVLNTSASPTYSHSYATAGTYTVTLTVTDDGGLTDTDTVSVTVNTINNNPSTLVSDDFDATSLNTSVWTHIDPQNDSTLSFTGTGTSDALMELTVPSGSSHDPWTSGITGPYISQVANDVDFEVEIKFESEVLSAWQMQGLLIKENETDFMRFDFYHNGTSGSPYVFSAAVENQSGQYKINNSITAGVPLWMRVNRQGDTWTQSYSYDGQTWTQAGSFFHQMTVTEVGIHSSNYNPNPSHTTQVDYFWNTALSNTDDTNTGGNVAPMADAGNAHTVNESASFTLDGSASSDTAPGSITSYEWSDSTGVLNTSASPTYSHSYATAGTYTVTLTVTDDGGLTDTDTVSVTVNTINNNPSTLVSDDFDATSLNTSVWTHIDPQGDSTLDFSGTGTSDALMELTVPSGSSHDSWTSGINSPYISQAANDVDFEVEVKFESEVLSAWQMQGLLIKENETDFMRFDFYHRGNSGSPYIFSGVVENQSGQYKINNSITAGVPLWMRVNRQGDTWTQSYSYDGQSWTVAGSFVHSIIVTEVGIHSSNYNPNPSHTTQVDYFWNTALSNTDDTNTGGNVAPMADAGNAHTVNESASFTLDGSASSDTAPGSITSYEWSDSTGVLNTSASPTYSHSYATAGTYTITLTVTDDGGLTDTDTVSVTVNTGNVAPVADAGSAHTVIEGISFTLDGSASSDTAPGSITSYEWSDSTGVLNTSASPTYSHSYATAGTYTVTLTVTDDGGLTDTDTVSVTVNTGNVAPVADAGSAHTVIEGISFTLDGSASSDTAPGSITSYEWSDSTGVLNTSASPTYSHSYATAGTYTVTLTVTDDGGLTDTDTVSVTVNTINNNPSTLVSDDFDATSLNTSVWTHIDPQSDSTLSFTGTGTSDALMELTVPSGSSHDPWTSGITGPYISQVANDVDFEVEIKFESPVLSAWQIQGLLIKESETHFMRFDFYNRDGSGSQHVFSGILENQTGDIRTNSSINAGVPMWMRVNRQGDTWTQSYSYDGQSWTVAGSFVHSIIVTEVGIHSSNYNPNPSHTTQVDYFWNTALSNTDDTNTGGNVAPMADAGNAHTVNESASFTLDGSASSDTAPGSITSYEWSDSTGVLNTSASPTYSYSYATAGTYTVTLTVTDDGGLTDTDTVSVTVNTINNNPSTLVSDDFDATSLNTSVWTHIDPQGDSTLSFSGTGASNTLMELTVPSGSSHDSWASGIGSPYISQVANDVDFEVEVKFESEVLSAWQMQGLLIKENETDFMRFDFYHRGNSGSPYIFSGVVENQSGQYKINNSITAGVPLWMRVNRQGDTWTQSYSYDGQSWTVAGSFVHSIIVTEVGIHSSNYNPNPSHTTQVDYFWVSTP